MAIDDPLEKIRQLVKDGDLDGIGAALQLGAMSSPVFKIFAVAKGIADGYRKGEKVTIAIHALCDELERIQEQWPKDLEKSFETDWFKRAVTVLMEESARAVNEDYARLLARITANGCFPTGQDAHRQENLASYIHDLARLGTDDIQFLKLLKNANLDAIKTAPNLNMSDAFILHFDEFKREAASLGIDPDDTVSLGARLGGFGLAYEAPRNNSRQSPVEHCFRPTKRGLYLLGLLEAAELPVKQQN